MRVHELSRTEARRIAVRAQLLDTVQPPQLVDVVRRLTLLQADQTAAVAPSADLVAWGRLGSTYSPHELATALDDGWSGSSTQPPTASAACCASTRSTRTSRSPRR